MERDVTTLASILKCIAVLVAALMIGNWFLAEVKKARSQRKPWYQPYLSIPGLLILLALLLPIIIWIINK
jgi:H+/Cl- antiporter ClcA